MALRASASVVGGGIGAILVVLACARALAANPHDRLAGRLAASRGGGDIQETDEEIATR